jgi:hypothetical protein
VGVSVVEVEDERVKVGVNVGVGVCVVAVNVSIIRTTNTTAKRHWGGACAATVQLECGFEEKRVVM